MEINIQWNQCRVNRWDGQSDASFGFDNNMFTGDEPKPVKSDWTATLRILQGSSVKYTYDSITAEEGIVPGLGEFTLVGFRCWNLFQ